LKSQHTSCFLSGFCIQSTHPATTSRSSPYTLSNVSYVSTTFSPNHQGEQRKYFDSADHMMSAAGVKGAKGGTGRLIPTSQMPRGSQGSLGVKKSSLVPATVPAAAATAEVVPAAEPATEPAAEPAAEAAPTEAAAPAASAE
jgi:hypothetical protein